MRQVFYVSRASQGMNEASVRPILYTSQQNNRRQDVTGCLLFSGQHFAQTLEGDAGVITELVRKIAADPRHHDVVVLVDRSVDTRLHPYWSMGFLYNLGLADQVEELLSGKASTQADAIELMEALQVDSLMGPLT